MILTGNSPVNESIGHDPKSQDQRTIAAPEAGREPPERPATHLRYSVGALLPQGNPCGRGGNDCSGSRYDQDEPVPELPFQGRVGGRMAARARRQFLADLGRHGEAASQGPPQADQGRLRTVGQARCRSQGPRLPYGQCSGGTHRERSPREKSDRGTQGEIARPARSNVYPDGSPGTGTPGRSAVSPDGRRPSHYPDTRGTRPGQERCSRREDVDRYELASVLMPRRSAR